MVYSQDLESKEYELIQPYVPKNYKLEKGKSAIIPKPLQNGLLTESFSLGSSGKYKSKSPNMELVEYKESVSGYHYTHFFMILKQRAC